MIEYDQVPAEEAQPRRPVKWLGRHLGDCAECTGRLATCPVKVVLPLVAVAFLLFVGGLVLLIVVMYRLGGIPPAESVAMLADYIRGGGGSPSVASVPPPRPMYVVPFEPMLIFAGTAAIRGWVQVQPGATGTTTMLLWPATMRGTLAVAIVGATNTTVYTLGPVQASQGRVTWPAAILPGAAVQAARDAGDYLALTLDSDYIAVLL